MSEHPSLRDRIEQFYATVPLNFAVAEEFGSLRLFVRKTEGTPYYGGPFHARPVSASPYDPVPASDLAGVRARQRELGVPGALEWLAEVTPSLRATAEAAGLAIAERPLMVLDPGLPLPAQSLPEGVTTRALEADDPDLPAVLALPGLAFAEAGTAVGPAGRAELGDAAGRLVADGTVDTIRPSLRAGHKTLVAAFAPDGLPLAAGHYHPVDGTTEIGGIGTLPAARRQGLGAAVMVALAGHAREHGVQTVFLAYALESVARLYARLNFRPAGTTLLIADQPARGQ
ncbi:GNAT family N-acetyltransferase [Streptomyces sp. HB132]|uniref:GNAT family N-acetyltransferase n=1 Tax=Streptomyces sp. HB132 TaxID=767388 RepID=UPI00195FB637|nr:GNAT family N-acetyltransferase [Streptomyces sp. HB132]MBM7441323.1 ribosomal protein S18 acetylase RimI-like enzyme [Streptomyces sp. HB132]